MSHSDESMLEGMSAWPYPVDYDKENEVDADVLVLGGGVAANSTLRTALQHMCDSSDPPLKLQVAPKQYCTDNAVMVASLAYYKFKAGLFADLTLEPKASGS